MSKIHKYTNIYLYWDMKADEEKHLEGHCIKSHLLTNLLKKLAINTKTTLDNIPSE